jgi:SH3-like domain-containing protein
MIALVYRHWLDVCLGFMHPGCASTDNASTMPSSRYISLKNETDNARST